MGFRVQSRISCSYIVFRDSLAKFGLPNSVRTDHGGENIDIWRYMIASHDGDISCVKTGSSTYNSRVERLWRDVHRSVVLTFADVFRSVEAEGYLDPLNEVYMFCLHHIFLPRINLCLQEFQESWNNHGLSTEGNMSPYQLFLEGSMYIRSGSDSTLIQPALNDIDVSDLTGEHVRVPPNRFSPCSALTTELSAIDVQHRYAVIMEKCYNYVKLFEELANI